MVRIAVCSSAKGCFGLSDWFHIEKISFSINCCSWKDTPFCCAACRRLPSVYMGDRVDNSNSSISYNSKQSNAITGKKTYKKQLVASRPKGFVQRNCEPLVSLTCGDFGSRAVGRATFFLLKVAALEAVRRFSESRCPCVWRGLQGLQILVYPPFKWIQRWAPFRGLVKSMQVWDYQFLKV